LSEHQETGAHHSLVEELEKYSDAAVIMVVVKCSTTEPMHTMCDEKVWFIQPYLTPSLDVNSL
jgi:hypothetical protein